MSNYGKPGTAEGPWAVRETAPHIGTWMVFDSAGLMVCEVTNRAVAEAITRDHNAMRITKDSNRKRRQMAKPTDVLTVTLTRQEWSALTAGLEHSKRLLYKEVLDKLIKQIDD